MHVNISMNRCMKVVWTSDPGTGAQTTYEVTCKKLHSPILQFVIIKLAADTTATTAGSTVCVAMAINHKWVWLNRSD